jgi:hypothetical protein
MPTLAKPTLAKPTLAKPTLAMPTLAKPMPATPMPTLAKPMPATTKPAPPLVKNVNEMEEVMIDYNTIENDTISLKNPNDVYQELYKKAREKAKQCRIAAIEAYLEAKQIKTKYMLYDEDESDDLSDDDIISDDEN